jgi:chromosome segregation ATPase
MEVKRLRALPVISNPFEKITSGSSENRTNGTELEDSKHKIQKLETELQSLHEDLEATVLKQREAGSTANEAIQQLENEISALREKLEESSLEKSTLCHEIADLKTKIDDLQDAHHNKTKENEESKIRISQLEMDHERNRFTIRELKSKLNESELASQQINQAEEYLKTELANREAQVNQQKLLLADIDRERDGFQQELDQKAERIHEMTGKCTFLT